MLRVVVESASGLPKKKLGSPDPIASVVFKGETKKTRSVNSEINPVWKETLEFDLKGSPLDSSSFIDVLVKDFETLGKDKFIGSAKVYLKDLASGQVKSLPSKNLALVNDSGQNIGATIDLIIGYEPPANSPPNPNDQPDAGVVGNAGMCYCSDPYVRIRIIEGRQLPGNNIKPVVKIQVCGETHRTRIKRGNNPFFDEMFFYNVHMLPSDLFDQHVSIRVSTSHSAHCVIRKWLLLNDPDDSSSGAKGYLKVSMFIVGTGDDPPVEKREQDADNDDVESNLLLPAGVALRWVLLQLKVYRGEDIPQMDDSISQSLKEAFGGESNKKNLVDPFVEAWFAGKKFPSMCERIKLTVFDWDRLTKNDAIGTTYLNLNSIASSGGAVEGETGETEVGFLPAFGPSFINLYGSPREFTSFIDPYEDLNYGKASVILIG
ncbi:Myoferlin [Bagarius yarrelli]|uniref:Myoferlin n=1 Tax=Bagarius yarrelli TaxID=175774 RepID=A0A556TIM4_BAGYA|nr:Myoferlin [Bagarius yarrelli]